MPIFIWISEGPTGEDAKPLLASSDPRVIKEFMRVLQLRICGLGAHGLEDVEPGRPKSKR